MKGMRPPPRAVSPDPNLPLYAVGVPLEVAKDLTFPETVTAASIHFLCHQREKGAPGCVRPPSTHVIFAGRHSAREGGGSATLTCCCPVRLVFEPRQLRGPGQVRGGPECHTHR